ncbi:cadherin-like beta sandwich domain-containing protein [Candidatus Poriferisodalis sp.]|uniref:cadherin-like beta sandwich domain-containing protein n=1 Tax=Candidatus Poriferisodalis sp. TaxID=3101277 RepID=UPI003B025373
MEFGSALQMGSLAFYRRHGDSLIWDLLEGVIAGEELVESRSDDPADLDAYRDTEKRLAVSHPLVREFGPTTLSRLDVDERIRNNYLLGDNCLIWCASMEPQTPKEWELWHDSLESHYDHTTFIGDPAEFARQLAMMATSQHGILASTLEIQHPTSKHIELCHGLIVCYGPVVYLDDPRAYILQLDDPLELIIRRIFTKTMDYRHQREYRFAILAEHGLSQDTLRLRVSHAMRQSLNAANGRTDAGIHLPEVTPTFCMPSPRILQCFGGAAREGAQGGFYWSDHRVTVRPHLSLSGTQDQRKRTRSTSVSDVLTADYDAIEAAIRTEPHVSDDARVAKLTIDGGPGTKTDIYCFEGIRYKFRYVTNNGRALFRYTKPHGDDEYALLVNNQNFDDNFALSHDHQQLILSAVPMNPAASVTIDQPCPNPDLPANHVMLCETCDTEVTVTATSEDGTETSSFQIVVDQALHPANRSHAA